MVANATFVIQSVPHGAWLRKGKNEDGEIRDNSSENTHMALKALGCSFEYDYFTRQVCLNGSPIDSYEKLERIIEREFNFCPGEQRVIRSIKSIAMDNQFSSHSRWLRLLPAWNEKSMLARVMPDGMGTEDTPLNREAGYIIYRSIVRRSFYPGCQLRVTPSLLGDEYVGKSRFCQIIAIRMEWYTDDVSFKLDSRPLIERTTGKAIVEIAEARGIRAADIDHIKAFTTRQYDCSSLKYEVEAHQYPRQYIMIPTSNETEFIREDSGGTRWLPIVVKGLDQEWFRKHNEQLYAEAMMIERDKGDKPIEICAENRAFLGFEREKHREKNEMEEELRRHIEERSLIAFTPNFAWKEMLGITDMSKRYQLGRSFGSAMKVLGFEKACGSTEGERFNYWRKFGLLLDDEQRKMFKNACNRQYVSDPAAGAAGVTEVKTNTCDEPEAL